MAESVGLVVHVEDRVTDRLLVSDPGMRKMLDKLIKKVMKEARGKVSRDARGAMAEDPRAAYKAVKHAVYRGVLGGSISILNKRKAGNKRLRKVGTRKLDMNPHQRGGNRVKRVDDRRNRLDTYYGSDRAFILRFVQGTSSRDSRYGNRGAIAGRRWFEVSATLHLKEAIDTFFKGVDEYVKGVVGK